MKDLCSLVCQHLAAYITFVWVDDKISFVFPKKGSALKDLAIPVAEKAVSDTNIFFFHLQVFPP